MIDQTYVCKTCKAQSTPECRIMFATEDQCLECFSLNAKRMVNQVTEDSADE